MLFPNHIEQKIGFDKIREILNEQCIRPMGQKFANSMKFQTDSNRLEKLLAQLREMTQLLEAGLPFPHQNYFDINEELIKANIIGNWLSEEELFKIKLFFKINFKWKMLFIILAFRQIVIAKIK